MDKDDENILVFAFRYALGRQSTAPGIVAERIERDWKHLPLTTQGLIKREIFAARENSNIGMECDEQTWVRILAL